MIVRALAWSDIAAWVALGWLICGALIRLSAALFRHRSDGVLTSAAVSTTSNPCPKAKTSKTPQLHRDYPLSTEGVS